MALSLQFLMCPDSSLFFFFFNDTATTEIYTLSLHDALPISSRTSASVWRTSSSASCASDRCWRSAWRRDRKSTRLNSSHGYISYAVFCLKKKKKRRTLVSDLLVRHNEPARRVNAKHVLCKSA